MAVTFARQIMTSLTFHQFMWRINLGGLQTCPKGVSLKCVIYTRFMICLITCFILDVPWSIVDARKSEQSWRGRLIEALTKEKPIAGFIVSHCNVGPSGRAEDPAANKNAAFKSPFGQRSGLFLELWDRQTFLTVKPLCLQENSGFCPGDDISKHLNQTIDFSLVSTWPNRGRVV